MKRWFVLSLLLLAPAVACDREDAPAPPPPVPPPEFVAETPPRPAVDLVVERPLLWSVKSKSGAVSHLLGSYHIGTDFAGLPALPDELRAVFERASTVVLEADTGVVDPELQKYVVLEGRASLKSMLDPDQWDLLVEQTGLPPRSLERLRPHAAVGVMLEKWVPEPGERGMDGRFRILAKAHEKDLVFLETPTEQLKIVSQSVTVEHLARVLDDVPGEKARTLDLLAAFRKGDDEAVEKLIFDPDVIERDATMYEKLFWVRNASWVEPLGPILDRGGALVVVGAGHLLGEKSLVDLLASEGYEVRRVEP